MDMCNVHYEVIVIVLKILLPIVTVLNAMMDIAMHNKLRNDVFEKGLHLNLMYEK